MSSFRIGWVYQISGETVGDVRVVADMHEKAAMAQEAEAFIALPGEFLTSKF